METMAAELGALSSESSFSGLPTDASSNIASLSSTPPTTVSPDTISLASDPDVLKLDSIIAPLADSAASQMPESDQPLDDKIPGTRQETPTASAIVVAESPLPIESAPAGRARRARASLPVYNLTQLSNSSTRRVKGDAPSDKRRRTISGDTLVNEDQNEANGSTDTLAKTTKTVQNGADALNIDWSISGPNTPNGARIAKKSKSNQPAVPITRRATRLSGAPAETLTTKLATLGKRSKKTLEKVQSRLSRELRRIQDTNEFAHIDDRPVRHTVWSNGKYVDLTEQKETPASPARKKEKAKADDGAVVEQEAKAPEPEKQEPVLKKRRVKKWLDKGLYAGQEAPTEISKGLTAPEKKKLATLPELMKSSEPNKTFPAPMYNGLRVLLTGRDFKLPFDVCNPLPPGQPKPAAYRTMTKNRFVGDAAAYWKKTPHFEDFASKCVCKPEDGCGEDCQNRIMLYECDETNCNLGKYHCNNRAFQNLQERTKKGGRYRVGVEVVKTSDRGYGVRSNRCFEPNQIIMEYTGEIITAEECERRMNEEYKDNECYYLMSFDQNMIIDATTGSIARFVNHSCSPNCRMIKWIVSGQPRMALFAGDNPITTGDELTYDYNFDPFSAKNVQKCLCGSPNCRGVLGPKPKEVKVPKPPKEEQKKSVKGSVKAGKRKLKELLSGDKDEEEATKAAKKRKIKTPTGVGAKKVKPSLSVSSLKAASKGAAKGAATAIKKSVSTISVNAKSALNGPGAKVQHRKTSTSSVLKTYSRKTGASATVKVSSRSSSLTIVAAGSGSAGSSAAPKATKKTPKNTPKKVVSAAATPKSAAPGTSSARKRTPSWKALASDNTPVTSTPKSSGAKSAKGVTKVRSALELSRSATKIRVVQE